VTGTGSHMISSLTHEQGYTDFVSQNFALL
jgi:hypothetical protein